MVELQNCCNVFNFEYVFTSQILPFDKPDTERFRSADQSHTVMESPATQPTLGRIETSAFVQKRFMCLDSHVFQNDFRMLVGSIVKSEYLEMEGNIYYSCFQRDK